MMNGSIPPGKIGGMDGKSISGCTRPGSKTSSFFGILNLQFTPLYSTGDRGLTPVFPIERRNYPGGQAKGRPPMT
jgi:hypothetical protein